ncbi:MAG TPA: glycine cleavage system aminomethyltransferase GcvT [Clostridiaceae bacterium]|nr:glycine cleavage system aminomethyltransferase GcvT [Clostridiaceae bacterium]
MKKTPLYEVHCNLGGKIVDFAGWALPVQYTGIIEEHEKVRNVAGLFDVSHMGEILVQGQDAERFIQKIITNNVSRINVGRIQYSPMCYPNGGVVDDVLIYKLASNRYLLVVNASNTDKDFKWILDNKNVEMNVEIKNLSSEYAQLAIQGPKSQEILNKLTDFSLETIKPFRFEQGVSIAGVDTLISRTGYTGEDGFELYISPKDAVLFWNKIMEAGKPLGLIPAGLGARDTLRFEASMPLYGQEISEDITPIEAGLDRFVKLDKGDFIGKDALIAQKEKGPDRKLIGFEMIDRGIPRTHYNVSAGGETIGIVTSGNFSPTLKKTIGMALVKKNYADIGQEIEIIIRNRPLKARTIAMPFYSRR